MALKKLSISDEQAQQVKELLVEGLSHYKISAILNIARSKIWRNAQVMGVGKKRIVREKSQYFKWEEFGNRVI